MKHAYLIMAHNEFYILEKLIKLLDDEHNDIYLHVDLKAKDFDKEYFQKLSKKSHIYFVNRLNNSWGGFSLVECELLLLQESTKRKYDYYHLLSGVDMPLKSKQEIYNFFEKNNGKEFVAFSKDNKKNVERIKYYHYFIKNIKKKIYYYLHYLSIILQKVVGVNRLRNTNIVVKKGAQWFSITHKLAIYVLKQKEFIYKYFTKSLCSDEVFLQTIVYNSKFYKNVYKDDKNSNSHFNIMRYVDWKRGNNKSPYTFQIEDKDELLNSNMLFARKFSTCLKEQKELVDYIYNLNEEK